MSDDQCQRACEALRDVGWEVEPSTENPEPTVPGLTAWRGTLAVHVAPHVMAEHETYPDWEARLRDTEQEPRDIDQGHGKTPITALRDAGVQV